jgi:hypothetical protein
LSEVEEMTDLLEVEDLLAARATEDLPEVAAM